MTVNFATPSPLFTRPEILQHPNIPKPLHGTNPRSILGKEWWDEKRQIAYAEQNYCCWACGIHKSEAEYRQWLEAHESYDINYRTGKVVLVELVAICHYCHNFIHSGRLLMLSRHGKIPHERATAILDHGLSILDEAKLEPFYGTVMAWNELTHGNRKYKSPKRKKIAGWDKWHLVLDGKKHYSKFKNINEWEKFYK